MNIPLGMGEEMVTFGKFLSFTFSGGGRISNPWSAWPDDIVGLVPSGSEGFCVLMKMEQKLAYDHSFFIQWFLGHLLLNYENVEEGQWYLA